MICKNCGASIPNGSKVCAQCGARPDSVRTEPAQSRKTANGGIKSVLTADRILCVIAVILLLLVLFLPFINLSILFFSQSYTLLAALDLTTLFMDGGWLRVWFIVVYAAFLLLFAVFKFVGMNRILSLIGCVGSWFMFIACTILVGTVNGDLGFDLLSLGFGFYVWIAGGILEIVSLCLDHRRGAKKNT